ncbi:hypothetical protein, partial [Tardiphaga sp. P5_C10]
VVPGSIEAECLQRAIELLGWRHCDCNIPGHVSFGLMGSVIGLDGRRKRESACDGNGEKWRMWHQFDS